MIGQFRIFPPLDETKDKPFKLNPKYESNLITISSAARPVEQINWMGRVLEP
jgi:hypothetical protein